MALSKAITRVLEEILPNLRVPEKREGALKLAQEDPEACVLAVLLEIKSRLYPDDPGLGVRHSLQHASYDGAIKEARKLLDEEEKSSE